MKSHTANRTCVSHNPRVGILRGTTLPPMKSPANKRP